MEEVELYSEDETLDSTSIRNAEPPIYRGVNVDIYISYLFRIKHSVSPKTSLASSLSNSLKNNILSIPQKSVLLALSVLWGSLCVINITFYFFKRFT